MRFIAAAGHNKGRQARHTGGVCQTSASRTGRWCALRLAAEPTPESCMHGNWAIEPSLERQ